jgi:hypothetical protein
MTRRPSFGLKNKNAYIVQKLGVPTTKGQARLGHGMRDGIRAVHGAVSAAPSFGTSQRSVCVGFLVGVNPLIDAVDME